jgi:hypothetical protein
VVCGSISLSFCFFLFSKFTNNFSHLFFSLVLVHDLSSLISCNSFFAIPLYNELQEIKELKSCTKTSEQEKMREIISKFREQEKAKK